MNEEILKLRSEHFEIFSSDGTTSDDGDNLTNMTKQIFMIMHLRSQLDNQLKENSQVNAVEDVIKHQSIASNLKKIQTK